ncbi:hypothetical protein RND71_040314 [Anisodus tanguticus]|uniref:Uncharacterized protein n=1 Tax=Anisodus tanguticus TaxID=243964 RepID=A0AAE1QVE0_9SOLA|nr:hypothetical protein RND71_040314 [Anisodus tanguticus]
MHEFSSVDGFAETTESLAEMIKLIANEPSMGIFYIQQHTQSAVPNIISLKNDIEERSREVILHAEDSEDSITVLRSIKDTCTPIANEMIKDLRHSLAVMLKKQPKGSIRRQPGSTFHLGRTSSWSPATWGRSTGPQLDGEMLVVAKEKANALSAAEVGFSLWVSDANDEELPLSGPTNNELQVMQVNKSVSPNQLHPSS